MGWPQTPAGLDFGLKRRPGLILASSAGRAEEGAGRARPRPHRSSMSTRGG
ncbi:hypothetical protein SFR_4888 [Streptomyces sp. FR-008]|nr:hypothetical protein SFR_4888 [Streptomyces sp. FR-008]